MADKEDMILQSLARIDKKLDKHEEQFRDIASALKKLVEVDIRMQEHSESLGRAFARIETIENSQQSTGCSVLNNYWNIRNEQMKQQSRTLKEFEERIKKNEDIIDDIKSIPNKIMMKMLMTVSGALATWFIGYIILEHHFK